MTPEEQGQVNLAEMLRPLIASPTWVVLRQIEATLLDQTAHLCVRDAASDVKYAAGMYAGIPKVLEYVAKAIALADSIIERDKEELPSEKLKEEMIAQREARRAKVRDDERDDGLIGE